MPVQRRLNIILPRALLGGGIVSHVLHYFVSCSTWLNKYLYIWVFPKIGIPQNGWFIRENPIKMDDLGENTPIFGNTHIYIDRYLCVDVFLGRHFSICIFFSLSKAVHLKVVYIYIHCILYIIGKMLVPLGWYPSCLTPQGALLKGIYPINTHYIRCIWG